MIPIWKRGWDPSIKEGGDPNMEEGRMISLCGEPNMEEERGSYMEEGDLSS